MTPVSIPSNPLHIRPFARHPALPLDLADISDVWMPDPYKSTYGRGTRRKRGRIGGGGGAWASRAPGLHLDPVLGGRGPPSLPPSCFLIPSHEPPIPVLVRFVAFCGRPAKAEGDVDRCQLEPGRSPWHTDVSHAGTGDARGLSFPRAVIHTAVKVEPVKKDEEQMEMERGGLVGRIGSSPAWPPVWPSTRLRMSDTACARRATANGAAEGDTHRVCRIPPPQGTHAVRPRPQGPLSRKHRGSGIRTSFESPGGVIGGVGTHADAATSIKQLGCASHILSAIQHAA